MPTYLRRRLAGRRILGAYRKYRARRAMGYAARKGRFVRRSVGLGNPSPTFVETFGKSAFQIPTGVGVGQVFGGRISDIPQIAQYANLYKQYRINWIKVICIPDYSGLASDNNSAGYNAGAGVPSIGMTRVAYAIQDSPNVTVPANELAVLQDNGCKIKTVKDKWVCSFKPVPDVQQVTTAGNIWARQKFRQWFNFDLVTTGNNPFHGACAAYFSLPASTVPSAVNMNIYYKISFTLRDPQ